MKITYLWPIALVLLVPVIIIMYLLKQKAKEHAVSSLYLWHEMYKNVEANTPWEKLKKNWLMILQIIVLLVLIFALMSPYLVGTQFGNAHSAIIIDNSASMNNNYKNDTSGLEEAKKQAIDYVQSLRAGTGISLIVSNKNAVMLISNTDDKNDVIDSIKTIEPTNLAGNSEQGLEMITSMKSQWEEIETVIFTDTNIDMKDMNGYVVNLYNDTENVGISYLSHGLKGGKESVLAKVVNYGANEQTRDVTLYQEDAIVEVQTVTLQPGESQTVYFESGDIKDGPIRAELNLEDSLVLDNVCYDVVEEQKQSKVLLMTEGNAFLEKALLQIDGIDVLKSNDISAFDTYAQNDFDMYIFDGMLPDNVPTDKNMMIMNVVYPDLFQMDDYHEGVYVDSIPSVITQYIDGLTFGAAQTFSYQVPSWAKSIFKAGDADVGFYGIHDGIAICVLGFDLHDTDLPLKMQFPILVYNIINECVNTRPIDVINVNCGDSVEVNTKIENGLPSMIKPDLSSVEMSDYRGVFTDTSVPGIYTMLQDEGAETVKCSFAANFPSDESHVAQSIIQQSDNTKVETKVKGEFPLRTFIIAVALGLLCLEWITYLRR